MNEFMNSRIGDRYEIRERIGAGGMARVFKGWDTNLERFVAIKVLYEHLAEDATFKQRFEREAKFVASFNHPNIVQIYDFNSYERDGQSLFYMVMALIPGETLKHKLEAMQEKHEFLSHDQVLQIMLNLTDALGYAHERGMVHRDVKPGNILFDERGQAILTDFGIARLAQGSRLTRESVTVGTPAYMSPEQAVGADVDARSDLYALGIILYELLTGMIPFEDDGSLSILLKHMNDPVPPISKFSSIDNPSLENVIQKALAKDASIRYQTAQEFADDLKAAFSGILVAPPRSASTGKISVSRQSSISRVSIVLNTISNSLPPATKRYAPLGIFTFGMILIGVLVGASFFSRASSQIDTLPNSVQAEDAAESMTEEDSIASMTSLEPIEFQSTFAPDDNFNSLWEIGENTMTLRELTPQGFYRFVNLNSGLAVTTVLQEDLIYDYVTISMEARLEEGSPINSAYGIVFRYQDNDHYNVFAVDGAGRYSIWVRSNGVWRELRNGSSNWTQNEVIAGVGSLNTLSISILGGLFTAKVNGVQVVNVFDDTLSAGRIGIYLANPPSEENAVLLIDSYNAVPTVPSMTEPSQQGEGR